MKNAVFKAKYKYILVKIKSGFLEKSMAFGKLKLDNSIPTRDHG